MLQIPDIRKFIGKDYILLEDFFIYPKHSIFTISSINSGDVNIKFKFNIDSDDVIKNFCDNIIKNRQKDLDILEETIKIWKKHTDTFVVSKEEERPIKKGYNEWYSLECYEYMKLGLLQEIDKFKNLSLKTKKEIVQLTNKKINMKIKDFNKIKFDKYDLKRKRQLKINGL